MMNLISTNKDSIGRKKCMTLLSCLIFLFSISIKGVSQDCSITDVTAEVVDCINGEFFVVIDFNHDNVSDSFHINGNGMMYGNFSYGNVPITLGPLDENSTDYEFVVIDNGDPDCSGFVELGVVECDSSGVCEIGTINVDFDECTSDSTYRIIIDFDYVNTGNVAFDLWANGVFFGFYPYTDLPLTINNFPLADGMTNGLLICDNDNPNCCEDASWPTPNCGGGDCSISDVTAEVVDCINGEFFVILNFNYDNVADSFHVNGNGMMYGNFSYGNVPITLGPLEGNATDYEFVVIDNGDPNCSNFVELGVVECDSSGDCEIGTINVDFVECTSDSTYRIIIDFDYANTGNVAFDLWANGEFFGFYPYTDLPLTINNFPLADGMTNSLLVCDNDNANCCEDVSWPTPNCGGGDCSISDVMADVVDCINGEFFVVIDFNYDNVADSFHVNGNGVMYGNFSYGNVPITLGPLTGNSTSYEFVVIDNGNPNCSDFVDVGLVECDSFDCLIWDVSVVNVDCQDSTYFIELNFEHMGTGDSFGLFHTYLYEDLVLAYADLPVSIGPFPTGECSGYDLEIYDIENSCSIIYVSEGFLCDSVGVCSIDVSVSVECSSDTTYRVTFDVENTGRRGDSVNLFRGSTLVGSYSYDDLPIILDFPDGNNNTTIYSASIQDNTYDCCGDQVYWRGKICSGDDCSINDLNVEVFDCDDGTFFVDIDFNHNNTSDSFEIRGNGHSYGFFSFGDLPITLGPLPANTTAYEFVIIDADFPDCGEDIDLGIVSCDSNNLCHLFDLVAQEVDCDNGEFYLEVDFEFLHVGDSFKVSGNGNLYGIYSYSDLPILIGPLSANAVINELVVMDLTFPDCMEDIALNIHCGGDCDLFELAVMVGDIVSDSTFELMFSFDFQNTSDSFNAYSGNVYVGTFAYADLPITIAEFPTRNLSDELLRVCDVDFMDCCAVIEFPVCGGEVCNISDATAEVVECDGDSVYVLVDFNIVDGSSTAFEIIGNGLHYGSFQYDDLPVLISFIYNEGDFVDLVMRDLENPTCLGYTFIEEVNCDENCALFDLEATFEGCSSDSTYHFLLDMNSNGTGGLGFDLWANGEPFGYYEYGNLPVFVENFPSSGADFDTILVCDNDNMDCCTQLTMPVPSCITGVQGPDQKSRLKILSSIGQWQINVSEPGDIAIYDMAGRTVRSSFPIDRTAILNDLAGGVYLITWTGWWGTVSKPAVFLGE